jgi:hypothetical protein
MSASFAGSPGFSQNFEAARMKSFDELIVCSVGSATRTGSDSASIPPGSEILSAASDR